MNNLIVTILSIALAAFLAIAGIFYVGPAFQASQARAIANSIVDQVAQMNNGMVQWSNDNNGASFYTAVQNYVYANCGSQTATIYCGSNPLIDPIGALLIPNYIQSTKLVDTTDWTGNYAVSGGAAPRWEIWNSPKLWMEATSPITPTAIQICKQVAIMARGPNALPLLVGAINPNAVIGSNPVIDCDYWAPGGSGHGLIDNCVNATVGGSGCYIWIIAQMNS